MKQIFNDTCYKFEYQYNIKLNSRSTEKPRVTAARIVYSYYANSRTILNTVAEMFGIKNYFLKSGSYINPNLQIQMKGA